MAITYPVTLPWSQGRGPEKTIVRPTMVVGVTESEFTRNQQIFEWPGAAWEIDVELPPMYRNLAAAWIAALTSLYGRRGTFFLGPRGDERTTRGTVAGGAITVNGAGQTGKTVLLAGWTGTSKAGDFFQINHPDGPHLYMNLKDTVGPAALDIYPPLRNSPDHGAGATFTDPVGIFRLMKDYDFSKDRAQLRGIKFSASDAI